MHNHEFVAEAGKKFNLKDHDPDYHCDFDKETTELEIRNLQEKMCSLQDKFDLSPMTRPQRVRVGLVRQRQPEANSLSCYASDADYTPVAIVR